MLTHLPDTAASQPGLGRARLLAGVGLVQVNRLTLRAGLRTRRDGWRRAAGLVLRGERSCFVLSSFGLDSGASGPRHDVERHFAERLHQFLLGDSASHIQIRKAAEEDRAERCAGPAYTLGFEPWADGPARFCPPRDWTGTIAHPADLGADRAALFNAVARLFASGRADLWLRINHVGADGVPMQELLARLEAAWGVDADVRYPARAEFAAFEAPRPCADVSEVQAFIDFAPLIEWRKRRNASLPEPLTFSAALIWALARRPEFEGLRIGTTVEVEAVDGLGRGVGVVVTRPAEYARRAEGLAAYARDFNRGVELARRRASSSCATLDAAALLSPRSARGLLRYALDHDPRAFGDMAVSIIKDAKVFGAPIAETGHNRGFIAVGSAGLPTRDGGKVGCITVKGRAEVIREYPAIIREAVGAVE
ncbi:MAG: hypothetical protein IT436_09560 [Phycisphaerales bacterium]|nr:hypothetical protein [Phycisphaerales bacterium]